MTKAEGEKGTEEWSRGGRERRGIVRGEMRAAYLCHPQGAADAIGEWLLPVFCVNQNRQPFVTMENSEGVSALSHSHTHSFFLFFY